MDFYPFNHKSVVLVKGNKAVLDCRGMHLCGYVALPIAEVPKSWHGEYSADALQYLSIHGGITYCEAHSDFVVFGFDCGHRDDDMNPDLRDPQYVMGLVESMEQQLRAYASRIDEWRAANRTRRIEIMQEIIDSAPVKVSFGFGAMIGMLGGCSEFGKDEDGAAEAVEVGEQPTTAQA